MSTTSIIIIVLIFINELNSQILEAPGRPGITKPEYLTKSCKLLTNSSTTKTNLRLYTAEKYLIWPEEVSQNESLFKFSQVAIGEGEENQVLHGELHLYQALAHPEKVEVKVYRLKDGNKEEISSLIITENEIGWRIFDVKKLSKNLTENAEDVVLAVEVSTLGPSRNLVDFHFVRINDSHHPTKMPLYMHFIKRTENFNSFYNRNSIDVYEENIDNSDNEKTGARCDALIVNN